MITLWNTMHYYGLNFAAVCNVFETLLTSTSLGPFFLFWTFYHRAPSLHIFELLSTLIFLFCMFKVQNSLYRIAFNVKIMFVICMYLYVCVCVCGTGRCISYVLMFGKAVSTKSVKPCAKCFSWHGSKNQLFKCSFHIMSSFTFHHWSTLCWWYCTFTTTFYVLFWMQNTTCN